MTLLPSIQSSSSPRYQVRNVLQDEVADFTILLSWVVQFDPFGNRDPSSSWEHKGAAADGKPKLMIPVRFGWDSQKFFGVLFEFWHISVDLA